MRRFLLWCAQNRWLATHVPRWRFARRAVKRFLPGEGFDAALTAAVDFRTRRIGAIFTLLGENITDPVDANYLALCAYMLPEVKHRRMRLVLGTHDTDLFAKAWRFAQAAGLEMSRMEIAMLYGIRTDQQMRLAREGFTVRDLVAYGDAWYGWYLRRLAERPANVWFVARQLLP